MDDETPLTKADLRNLATKEDLHRMYAQVDRRFVVAREDSTRILNLLINVEKRLNTKLEDHEKRMTRLELAA